VDGVGLGLDLGGTNARAAVVERASGRILAAFRSAVADRSPAAVAELAASVARQAAAAAGVDPRALGTAGVGVAGQCLGTTGVVLNAPNFGWRDVPLGELLARALGQPVRVANDLSVAAWGERCFGAARGLSDVLLVFVGTGVGSGLILGGRLHEGARGVAGELGHVQARPPGPGYRPRRCGCGAAGCLEAYAGGANIAARVREELAAGAHSAIRELAGGDPSMAGPVEVEMAFTKGDQYAVALWEEVADLLGTAVASAVTLLNPERVVLGGGVLLGSPSLERLVRARVASLASRSALAGLSIERTRLGDDAGVLGAALLPG